MIQKKFTTRHTEEKILSSAKQQTTTCIKHEVIINKEEKKQRTFKSQWAIMSYHRFEPEKSWCILKKIWCIAEIIITHKVSWPGYENLILISILHQIFFLHIIFSKFFARFAFQDISHIRGFSLWHWFSIQCNCTQL